MNMFQSSNIFFWEKTQKYTFLFISCKSSGASIIHLVWGKERPEDEMQIELFINVSIHIYSLIYYFSHNNLQHISRRRTHI